MKEEEIVSLDYLLKNDEVENDEVIKAGEDSDISSGDSVDNQETLGIPISEETYVEEAELIISKDEEAIVNNFMDENYEPEFTSSSSALESGTTTYRQIVRDADDSSIPDDEQGGLTGRNLKGSFSNNPETKQVANPHLIDISQGVYSITGFSIEFGSSTILIDDSSDDVESLMARVMGGKYLAILGGGKTRLCSIAQGVPEIHKGGKKVASLVNSKWQ